MQELFLRRAVDLRFPVSRRIEMWADRMNKITVYPIRHLYQPQCCKGALHAGRADATRKPLNNTCFAPVARSTILSFLLQDLPGAILFSSALSVSAPPFSTQMIIFLYPFLSSCPCGDLLQESPSSSSLDVQGLRA